MMGGALDFKAQGTRYKAQVGADIIRPKEERKKKNGGHRTLQKRSFVAMLLKMTKKVCHSE